ncbi:MAG: M15 family metallopeptidase [Candidatus Cellulosilyticum pullistercoris]|uniref:M15 family metallopeptidase n=1 Tax=Candidatus Cellulosilyticum pullistercoris TaxID=2838521 RepID=A0A9E2NLZ2_9FIRM|nr:M15 family metallopeptidase [Candidatus Cellulosilyticum pullistercoris]
MDEVLRAKHNKYSEVRRKRGIKLIVGIGLCVGAIIIVLNTPMKARLKARLSLLLNEIEEYTMANENQIPEIEHFKLSTIEVASKGNDMSMVNQYEYVTQRRRDLFRGNLQLINGSHACLFREMDQLVDVKANKNKSYKLMETNMKLNKDMVGALNAMMKDFEKATGKHDMILTSGYRTLADQGEVLQEKIKLWGEKEALEWAMLPGYSEHHSGYAVDMSIYTDEGKYVKYKGQDDYAWINQNCYKYGLIRRYTEEKKEITGVSDEQWHYRYIGVPHAYIVTKKNFCLEEYMDYLKQFTFGSTHLVVDCDAGKYEIYFVPSEGRETSVPVPSDKAYTISGNNEDGFIVTVTL